jgi:hypothetical protein
LDGALFVASLYGEDGDKILNRLRLGWTVKTYENYKEFREQRYKDTIICETTDLYTYLENSAADEGISEIDYIANTFGGGEDFCKIIIKNYYMTNIFDNLKYLEQDRNGV